uniref:Fork-head domain-containing protein n=1 Tax=Hucho hucho TaxID=62062 RepID=A0A4W5NEN7_9TELE
SGFLVPQPLTTIMTSELGSSLTSMDWLPQLTMRAAIHKSNAGHQHHTHGYVHGHLGHGLGKKNAPIDQGNLLDQEEVAQHRDGKPPYSYASLITFAINGSPHKRMTLSEIYQWICDNFPYYREAGSGWKSEPVLTFCLNVCFTFNCCAGLDFTTCLRCMRKYYW